VTDGGVERLGGGSFALSGVAVTGWSSIGGRMEGDGPLGHAFDEIWREDLAGEQTWEAAEQALWLAALERARRRAGVPREAVELVVGGDLLDQLYSTNFAARRHQVPLLGVFSACATFTEAVGIAATLVASDAVRCAAAGAASHHLAAERQFRFPVELGYQRAPTASWTATAAGAVVLERRSGPIAVTGFTVGRVIDRGSSNPMDMGTAMAPAAWDTITRHLRAFSRELRHYDRIVTGDLGTVGSRILAELVGDPTWTERHRDCGLLLYRPDQDVHNGGSGAGLAASVFGAHFAPELARGRWRRLLLVATGALFSPTSYQQGESIPSIAHAVELAHGGKDA
jgi:stage V sporulation protein AD